MSYNTIIFRRKVRGHPGIQSIYGHEIEYISFLVPEYGYIYPMEKISVHYI